MRLCLPGELITGLLALELGSCSWRMEESPSGCTCVDGNTASGLSSFFLIFGARYLLVGGSGIGPGSGVDTWFVVELLTVNWCRAFQVVNKPGYCSECPAPWV